jgi:hypothetical protein
VSRQIQISRGCIPYVVESMKGTDKVIESAIRHAKDELKIVKAGTCSPEFSLPPNHAIVFSFMNALLRPLHHYHHR